MPGLFRCVPVQGLGGDVARRRSERASRERLSRKHRGAEEDGSTVHVVGKRRLDYPPLALQSRLRQIFLLAAFRAERERMKTDPRQSRPALSGEEVYGKTTGQGRESRGRLGFQERP